MRILLVSFHFPPYNSVGAIRPAKLAKYLLRAGHEVRVLTAGDQPYPLGLDLELPPEAVIRTGWFNVNAPVMLLAGARARSEGFATAGGSRSLKGRLGRLYKSLFNIPDGQIGWLRAALQAGRTALSAQPADVIYASAPPFTGLMVAERLSREFGIPWVAEFRDLWTDNHDYGHGRMRRAIERRVETRVLATCAAMVTVSQPLADTLAMRFAKPVHVVPNGFDPDDFVDARQPPAEPAGTTDLTIVYTGSIYPDRYDFTSFCAALKVLGDGASRIRVNLFGRNLRPAEAVVMQFGLDRVVKFQGQIPHREALRMQRQADILLFFLWGGGSAQGIFTSKLPEYLGARRPILAIGSGESDVGHFISSRGAGTVCTSADQIADALNAWLRCKSGGRVIADLPPDVASGFSRAEQARELGAILARIRPGTRVVQPSGPAS